MSYGFILLVFYSSLIFGFDSKLLDSNADSLSMHISTSTNNWSEVDDPTPLTKLIEEKLDFLNESDLDESNKDIKHQHSEADFNTDLILKNLHGDIFANNYIIFANTCRSIYKSSVCKSDELKQVAVSMLFEKVSEKFLEHYKSNNPTIPQPSSETSSSSVLSEKDEKSPKDIEVKEEVDDKVNESEITKKNREDFGCSQDSIKALPHANFPQIKETDDGVEISPSPWIHVQPCLDDLIKKTLADSSYEKRTFRFQVTREDWKSYQQWEDKVFKSLEYPVGCSSFNKNVEGDRIEGVYKVYHKELTLTNATKKEKEARNSFAYRFFEGKFDKSHINANTFYNLMVRAGFTKEDFKKGKYGYQDQIFVKPLTLKQTTLPLCIQEVQDVIDTNLHKATQPFVTFIFELPPSADFKVQELFGPRKQEPLATIVEEKERRLYLCFSNDERKRLDLHGMSVDEAFKHVKEFIQEKYESYAETCEIITGRGNHENPGGARALLFSSFPKWMKHEEIRPLIRYYIPGDGDGVYKIFLKKPMTCDLTKLNSEQNPCKTVSDALKKVSQGKDLRLRIKVNETGFEHRLLHFLLLKEPDLFHEISPLSLHLLSGELRLNLRNSDGSGPIISSIDSKAEEEKAPTTSTMEPNSTPHIQATKKEDVSNSSLKQNKKDSFSKKRQQQRRKKPPQKPAVNISKTAPLKGTTNKKSMAPKKQQRVLVPPKDAK